MWRTVIVNKYGSDGVVGVLEQQMNPMGFLYGST